MLLYAISIYVLSPYVLILDDMSSYAGNVIRCYLNECDVIRYDSRQTIDMCTAAISTKDVTGSLFTLSMDWNGKQRGCPGRRIEAAKIFASGDEVPKEVQAESVNRYGF